MNTNTKHNNQPRILILGAGYAGLLVAMRLARTTRSLRAGKPQITLVNGNPNFVERIRLHEQAAGTSPRSLPIAGFLKGSGVELVLGRVVNLSPTHQSVTVQREQEQVELPYDYLVYALGSVSRLDAVPGAQEHAFGLAAESSAALRKGLLAAAQHQGHAIICGGGLTGIEAASEFAESYPGLQVALVTQGLIGAGLSANGREHVRATLTRLGVTLHEQCMVTRIEANQVQTSNGSLPSQITLWAGSFAVGPLAQQAGLQVNASGQIAVDRYLRSCSHPTIYAVGDAAVPVEDVGAPIRMACATALPMAAHLADNLLALLQDRPQKPYTFGYALQCISLGRRNGLIQFVQADDTPRERILRGRLAAWVKELVCWQATWQIGKERYWSGSYQLSTQAKAQVDMARQYAR